MMRKILTLFRLPFLPVVLAPFILLAPVYLAGKALFWGTPLLQFVPWWEAAWQTLRSGHLPLWNPLVGMGAPLLANYQSAVFYPPNWLYFILAAAGGLPALAWGQSLVLAFHLALAGCGTALLARRLGMGKLAQATGGLAFGLSGYLVARGSFLSMVSAAAWTPWILWAITPHVEGVEGQNASGTGLPRPGSARWILLALLLALQLLAGHAQLTWYTWLLAGLWIAYWAWAQVIAFHSAPTGRSPIPRSQVTRLLASRLLADYTWLASALLVAVALAAVQLLPTAEYLLQSQRSSAVDFEFAMTYSFWPWRLLGLVAPDLFGNPVHADFWGYATFWEDAIYLGLLPFLLALSALFRRKPLALFLLAVTCLSVLLALGKFFPLFPWLYRWIPSFDMFQAPARFLLWAQLSLALLAAIGAESWHRPSGRALYWTRLGAMGACAVAVGAGLAWYLFGDIHLTFIRATALAALWGFGVAVLSLAASKLEPGGEGKGLAGAKGKREYSPALWTWAVILWTAADLLVAGWGLNPGTDLSLYRFQPENTAQIAVQVGDGRIYLPPDDERQLKFKQYFRFDTYNLGLDWSRVRPSLIPNLGMLSGVRSANNFDPLLLGRYSHWMEALAAASPDDRKVLLGLMGVSVIESVDPSQVGGLRFTPVPGVSRWRWVPCSRAADGESQAWEWVHSSQVDPRQEVILEGLPDDAEAACDGGQTGEVALESESSNQVSLRSQAASPGWVVLADTWYPGWRAWVDGNPAPVYRADYLFRAVRVPAGDHRVVFEYRPVSFFLGALVSLVAAILIAALLARLWRRQRGRVHTFSHLKEM